MKRQQKFNQQNSRLILEELEERRLFSGGIEGLIQTQLDSDENAIYADIDANQAQTQETNGAAAALAAEQQSQEIAFVDAGVDNHQQLVDDLLANSDSSRNIEVVVLDRDRDGIEQISSLLQDRDDLDAIHIISHGSDGSIELGNTSLNADTLAQNNLSIAFWANSFAETGDILIYGCNLAETEAGQSLIEELGSLTLTDVAASTDATGHESLGGDWDLEYQAGDIETAVAPGAELQARYEHILAIINGTGGDDVLMGTASNDVISADAGNDVLVGGGGSDQLLGEAGDDAFRFTGAQDGDVYTVDGGSDSDTIDLTGYASSAITFGNGTMSVDMGGGQSFQIDYTGVESISFSDVNATVLNTNMIQSGFSGSGLWIDGAQAFQVDLNGGGTVDLAFNISSDTLSVTSASGVGTGSALAITDLNGTDLLVDQITLDADFGNLTTNTGVGSISLAGAGSDLQGTFTIGGDLGSITMSRLDGTLDVQGDAGTLTIGSEFDGSVSIDGSVDSVDVTGQMGGGAVLSVGGNAGYIHVAQDIVASASVSITGNVTTFEADDRILGSVDIGGDVGTFDLTGLKDGSSDLTSGSSVTIGGNVTTLTIQGTIKSDVVPLLTIDGSVGTMTVSGNVLSDVNIGGDLDSASMNSVDPAVTFTARAVVGTLVFDVGGTDYGGSYATPVQYVYNGTTGATATQWIFGTPGDDSLAGTAGDDYIDALGGDDVITAGSGDDLIIGGLGQDTVDYSSAGAGVTVDLTINTAQDTGGGGVDTLQGIETVIGSSHDDTFAFSAAQNGAIYTVNGGAVGTDTIDLTGYNIADAIFADGRVTIDTGPGFSFEIIYSNIDSIQFADTTATVLTGDTGVNGYSGSATYIEGDAAFTIEHAAGGTIDWSYVAATNTVSISDTGGTSGGSSITVTNHEGSNFSFDSFASDGVVGSLTTNVDINQLTFSLDDSRIDNITVNNGAGYIGSITYNGDMALGGTVTIDANVGTFALGPGKDIDSGSFVITGDLRTVDVPNFVGGTVIAERVIGQFDSIGDSPYSNNFATPTKVTLNGTTTTEAAPNIAPTAVDDAYSVTEDATFSSQATGWFNTDWQYSRTLSFDNSTRTENLVDFPVLVKLDSSVIDYAKTHDQGWDLRFFDQDGSALAHEVELWDEAGTSYVWVKIPQIDASSDTDSIVMYYGNAGVADSGENAAGVWSDYRAAYHLNENPGATGTLADAAGSFDAVNAGSTDTAGIIGNAQDFNGVDQSINLGDDRNWINNASGATLSIWMNADTTTGSGDLIGLTRSDPADTGASRITLIRNGDDIMLIARTMDDSSDSVSVTTTTNPLAAGSWHHITGTVDYASDVDNINIYVDGELEGTFSHNFTLDAIPNTDSSHAVIGADEDGVSGFFDGQLDEARIADQLRSADWVSAQYAAMTGDLISIGFEQTVNGVLVNDIDEDRDTLTVSELNGVPAAIGVATALPSGAVVTLNADGSFFYDTNNAFESLGAGSSTTDSFTYRVDDGNGETDTATVTFTINGVDDTASISGDISGSAAEGNVVSGDLNATDVEGLSDGTYFTITGAAPANGTAAIDPASGAWTFTPTDPDWFGSDSFEVTVTDDEGGTSTQIINVTLTNTNDAPVNTVPAGQNTNEDTALIFNAANSNLISIGDIDSNSSPLQVTLTSTNGALALSQVDGLDFTAGTGTADTTMTFIGTTANINAALDGLSFDPVGDFNGAADIQIQTSDLASEVIGNDTVLGSSTTAGDYDKEQIGTQINIAENGIITSISAHLFIDKTEDIRFGLYSDVAGEPGVLLAESIAASQVPGTNWYTIDIPDTAVTAGDYWIAMDIGKEGAYFYDATGGQTRHSNYDPGSGLEPNWTSSYASNTQSISVYANLTPDGATPLSDTDNIAITIDPVDDPAAIGGSTSGSAAEGVVVTGTLTATDVEGLTDGTIFSITGTPAANGTPAIDPASGAWTFTPTDPDWFGTDSFEVTVTDDEDGTTTQLISVTLNNTDDAASFGGNISGTAAEGVVVTGTLTATDADGLADGTYFTVTGTLPSNGAAAIDPTSGVWTFTPTDPDWSGSDSFEVTVTDDEGGTTTQLISVTLTNTDDAASIGGNITGTAAEGVVVTGTLTATDADGLADGTIFSITGTPAVNGTPAIDPASGAWTFTPTDPDWFGTDSFEVTVTDDEGGTTTQLISVTLTNTDDAASIGGNITGTAAEGVVVTGTLTATDADGLADGTIFSITGTPAVNGTPAIDPASGAWTFTPTDPDWFGTDSFEVTVTDDEGGTTTQIVNVTLTNTDDAATIGGNLTGTAAEGLVVTGTLTANDADGLTDGTIFSVTGTPAANGTAAINPGTGAWTFTPTDSDWFGTDSFEVTVTDDAGGTTTQIINVTLTNTDDTATIGGNITGTAAEGVVVTGTLTATDADGLTDGTIFTVTGTPAANGTAAINPGTGAWTFTPTDPDWFGTDSFEVTVTDDEGGTTTQIINVTLTNTDDAAVIGGNIAGTAAEGAVVTGTLTATDADGLTDGTIFTVTGAAPANGIAAINPGTGAWTFTPTDPDWFGTDSFEVTVTDDEGGTTIQIINVTLTNTDDAAVIGGNLTGTAAEGVVVTGTLTATDADGLTDGTIFTVTGAAPANGTAAINAGTGAWTFTPTDPDWFGTDSFEVTVTDDEGGTTTQLISVTLINTDDTAVIGGNITGTAAEGVVVTGNLTATDADGLTDGTIFTVTGAAPANGTAAINPASGAWTFTPTDPDWFGTDSFEVTVTDDEGGTTTQLISVTLTNTDDAAVIGGNITGTAAEGVVVTGTLTATDADGLTDGTIFTVTGTPAANGTAAINPGTGAWTFTPTDPDWFGTDSFEVTVTDDEGGTTTQIINVTLTNTDDAATIGGNTTGTAAEGVVVTGTLTATDADGLTDGTIFTVTGTPAANGTATINPGTGAWTFTPTDPDWFGTDSFEVTVTDDEGGTTTQIINVTLTNTDDAAVIGGNITGTAAEGVVVTGTLTATDADGLTDGDYFSITGTAPANGIAAINAGTSAWTFTPTDPDWFGTDSFEVTVTDDEGGTTTQIINVTLTNTDDTATIGGNITGTAAEGVVVTGTLTATDADGLTDGTIFTVTGTPAANGTAAINPGTGAWTFTPTDPDWFGTDSFEVTVTDDEGGTTTQIINVTLTNTDDAAVIGGNLTGTAAEGIVVTGTLTATDADGLTDGTIFTVTGAAPANGTAAINPASGAWTFTPSDPDWFGTDSFEVTVTDDEGGTTTQLISVTLTNTDDAAVIGGNLTGTAAEGIVVTGTLTATDADGLTDGTYFSVTGTPAANGTAAINPGTGAWTFTPTDPDWFGTDSFEVTVTDDEGGATTQIINVTLTNTDDAAVIGGNITGTAAEGVVVTGTLTATDADGLTDGTIFTVTGTPAANGTAAINPGTGAWTFTPTDPDWFGTDSFEVTVTDDEGGTTTQIINVTLTNTDDAAVIGGNIAGTAAEGAVVTGTLTATDADGLTDGTIFTVTGAAPANGIAAINPGTGAWTFTPTDPDWFGTDSFEVTVTDDEGGTTTQIINVTLTNTDDAATIGGNTTGTAAEGVVVTGTLTATDADGLTDGTIFTVTGTPAANGTATINPGTGAWTFTPTDPDWFGTDSFEVTVTDDEGGTTTQIINVTLTNTDDAAVIGGNITGTAAEGVVVTGTLTATDADGLTDGDYFSITGTAPANGIAAINAGTGAWTFTPTDPDWFGTDSFEVTVTDDEGGTTTQIINVTLTNTDDTATIGGNITGTAAEGVVVTGTLTATDADGLTDGTIFTVTGTPAANGTAAINPGTGAWTFTPTDPDWFGTDSFEVTVTDDEGGTTTQIINVTLTNTDDAAVIGGNIAGTAAEGAVVTGTLTATDADGLTDGTIFTVTGAAPANGIAAINPGTGAWTFTPTDPDWFGTDSFEVTVTDDEGGTTTQIINVTLTNTDDAATIGGNTTGTAAEGVVVTGTLTATDADGLTDGTIFTVTGTPAANGTATINPGTGAWTFTPTDPDWFGTDSFEVTVTDDEGGTTIQIINVTLTNTDDTAVIGGNITGTAAEGVVVTGTLTATDADGLTDGTIFTVTGAAPANGTAAIDLASGAWTFTPTDPDWFGTDSFEVTVTDDEGGTTTQIINVTLTNTGDAAVIGGNLTGTAAEGVVVTGTLTATDADGLTDGTYFTVTGTPAANGTAAINPGTGAWTFTPTDPDWFGTDSFEVTVTDDEGGTTIQIINVTLTNTDDAAVIGGNLTGTAAEGVVVTGTLTATDADGLTDGTIFTVTGAAPANGTAAINAGTGAWTFTPTDPDWFGTDSFEVTVTDDEGGTTTQLISVTLINTDDTAVIGGNITGTAAEGVVVTGNLTATDADGLTDGTIFTVTGAAPANGTAAINPASGAWTFTPTDPDWFGTDSFEVTVTDDEGGTTTQLISVTLTNTDDAAVIGGNITGTAAEGVVVTGTLTATDADGLTDGTIFTVTGTPAANGTAAINPGTGAWTFTPTDPDWFGTDSFEVTVTDDEGGTTTQIINVTLTNTDDAAVIGGNITGTAAEGVVVTGTLTATDADGLTDGTIFTVTGAAPANGTAAINPGTGAWSFTPSDPNWFGTDSFEVTVTDDQGGTTIQIINVTLTNANDPAIIGGNITGTAAEGVVVTGTLTATDADGLTDGTYFTVTGTAPPNGTAAIDPASGAWTFTPTDPDWVGSDSFEVTVTDDEGGTTTQIINVTLTNVADAPVIGGDETGSVSEDVAAVAGNISTGGSLTIADPDAGESSFVATTINGLYGDLTIDTAGNWNYNADNSQAVIQALDAGEILVDTLTVTTFDGSTHNVVITINGTEDAAIIGGSASGAVTEDSALIATNLLTITDADSADNPVSFNDVGATPSANGYGSFAMSSGIWTYSLNNSHAAVQGLGADDSMTDSFSFTASDGSSQVVTVTINGVDDAAMITGVAAGSVTEDSDVVDNMVSNAGQLNVVDADSGESSFVAQTVRGVFGDLRIDAAGNWRYSADNYQAQIQSLQAGDTLTDSLTVTTADGSTHEIVITINGTMDASTEGPPRVEPPVEEPPPDEESPPAEEVTVETAAAATESSLDEIVRIPQGPPATPPAAQQDEVEQVLTGGQETVEPVDYGPVIESKDVQRPLPAQQPALLVQNLDLESLSVQVSDDELLNEQYENELMERIDRMQKGMDTEGAQQIADDVEVQIIMGSTASLTAGIVSWVLRGGSLLASFMSTVPLLNRFDPLPILKAREDEEEVEADDDDDEKTQVREHAKKVDKMFSGQGNARQ